MASVNVAELTREQQWCRELRRVLKLKERRITIGKTDEQKLGIADQRARDGLKELAKANPKAFETLGNRYKSISDQSKTLKVGEEDAILVVTEELNVLARQIERETAFAELQGLRRGSKEHTKAKEAFDKADKAYDTAYAKLDGSFQSLISKANEYLDELTPMTFAEHSDSLPLLKNKKEKWATAYRDKGKDEFFDYAHALTDLADIGDLRKAALDEINRLQTESTLQAEYKGRYESKIERIKEVERNISGHVGMEKHLETLNQARLAAARVLQPPTSAKLQEPRYYTAFLELKKHVDKTSKFEKAALTEEKKLLNDLLKDPEVKNKLEAAQNALAELVVKGTELITDPEHDNHQRELNAALGLATTDKRKGIAELEKKLRLFEQLKPERSADRERCNTSLPVVERNLKELLYHPTPDQLIQLAQWEELLRMAKTDIGNCDFDSARHILEALQSSTAEAVKTSTTKRSDYEGIWNDRAHQEMRSFIRSKAAELRTDPKQAIGETYQMKHLAHAEKRAASGDFVGAIELLENLHSDTERQLKRNEFASSPDLTRAEREVASELEKCRTALRQLTDKLAQLGDEGAATKEQTVRLKQIEDAWNQNKKVAVDADDLDADGYMTRLQSLASDYLRLAGNDRLLTGAVKGAEHREGLKAFQVAMGEVELALEQLAGCDLGPRYTALAQERERIEEEAPDRSLGFEPSIQALNSLKTQVERAIQAVANDRNTVLSEFNTKAGTVRKAIDGLHKDVKGEMRFRQRKFFEPYFVELENEYAALIGMRQSPSLALLRQGVVELTALEQRIAQLKLDMDKPVGDLTELVANALGKNDEEVDPESFGLELLFDESPEGPTDPILSDKVTATFPLVIAALESIAQELKNENLTRCKPTRKRMLEEDFKAVSSDVKSLLPADALKRLLQFQRTLTAMIEAADTAAQRRAEFNTQLKPQAKTAFKTLTGYEPEAKLTKLFKDEKAYFAELGQQFVAAKGLIETEDKELEAIEKINDLLKKIAAVTNAPGELNKQDKEAQQRAFQAEKNEQQWDMYVKQYVDVTLPRVAEAMKVDGADTTQYRDCTNLLKKAQDHFKKTKDLSGASALLQLAKDRAEAAIKFPLGTAATARGELVKVAGRWKKSVIAFNASIDTVIDEIDKAVVDEGITVKQEKDSLGIEELFEDLNDVQNAARQAARTLNNLKRLFDPNVFDSVVAVMATKKVDPRQARAAREEGLREVRRYMDLLMSDPVLRKVMQTPRPFGTVEASALYTALRDLDLNLQRSA